MQVGKDQLDEVKISLDAVSPTFCLIKWVGTTVNLQNGTVKNCCHNTFKPIDSAREGQRALFNDTKADREMRREMLNGKKPIECETCWWQENNGQISDRVIWSALPGIISRHQEVVQHNSEAALVPSWLEINLSNVCNFKCMYCSAELSSSWRTEIIKEGPYKINNKHNDLSRIQQSGVNSEAVREPFWRWFKEVYPNLKYLTISGGEPLMSADNFRVLEYIRDNPNPDLEISINSNLCPPQVNWQRFLKIASEIYTENAVKYINLCVSIDCFGSRAEYIRFGLEYNRLTQNIYEWLEHTPWGLFFNITLSNLSITSKLDLLEFIYVLKVNYAYGRSIEYKISPVVYPPWQNINLLPTQYKSYLTDCIRFVGRRAGPNNYEFSDFELSTLTSYLNQFEDAKRTGEPIDYLRAKFFGFFSEYDKRRGLSFCHTFPELRNFWELCKDSYNASEP